MIIQRIDNVNFQMKEEHNFSFLLNYGKVFVLLTKMTQEI